MISPAENYAETMTIAELIAALQLQPQENSLKLDSYQAQLLLVGSVLQDTATDGELVVPVVVLQSGQTALTVSETLAQLQLLNPASLVYMDTKDVVLIMVRKVSTRKAITVITPLTD